MQPRSASVAAIAVDVLMLLSLGILAIALTGRIPFSGVYSSPFGVIKVGPRPVIWVGLFVFSLLARITLRWEGGHVSGLVTHPTATRLFLFALFVYNLNGRQIGAVDTIPARLLPYSILRQGNFDLDEFTFLYAHGVPGNLIQTGGRLVSAYPPGPALLALPFYLLPVFGGVPPDSQLLGNVEKLTAAVLTALSVALMYAAIKRLEGQKMALALSLIYAFGTSSFSISSQALWQHGPSQLLLAASLYCLVRGRAEPPWAALSGFTLGWAVLCRPTDILIAMPLAVYVFYAHRDQLLRFALLAVPSIIFMALYNSWYFGSIFLVGYDMGFFSGSGFATPFLEGLSGILFSPSRGLFIYSPIFLFSLIGIFLALGHTERLLFSSLSVSVILIIAVYSRWRIWWGGMAFGPRLLADITPLLTLLLIPAFQPTKQRRVLRWSFYTVAGLSMAIHALGAFVPVGWNPGVGEPSHRLWSWSEGELMKSVHGLLSKATGHHNPLDTPALDIAIDRASFKLGEEVSIVLILDSGGNPVPFDGFLEILKEGTGFGFIGPEGLSHSPIPFIVSSQIAGRYYMRLSFHIPQDAGGGRYSLQGLLYKAGASPSHVYSRHDRLFESLSTAFMVSR